MGSKTLQLAMTFSAALMFTLVAFNNVIDYCTNFKFVSTVLSMESIDSTHIQWRAITSPPLQHAVYLGIIAWEMITALVCWAGAFMMLLRYAKGQSVAVAGLTMGFVLFMVGFVVIASEWFYLWDTPLEPMQSKAILFAIMLASFAYFVSQKNPDLCT